MKNVAPITIDLPRPSLHGTRTLEDVLVARRSVREFEARELTPGELSRLTWAAQGILDADGRRTTPSAGGTYPLELYVILPAAVYHYQPAGHRLVVHLEGDRSAAVAEAAHRQTCVAGAPAVFAIAAVHERTEAEYGERAHRYVVLEAGHAAQNLLLEAVALGLGAVPVAAFDDARLERALGLPAGHRIEYLIPVGSARRQ